MRHLSEKVFHVLGTSSVATPRQVQDGLPGIAASRERAHSFAPRETARPLTTYAYGLKG